MRTVEHSDGRKGSARTQTDAEVVCLVAGGRAGPFSAMPFAVFFGKGSSMEAAVQIRTLFTPICPEW